jgi:hypothetical protein
LSNWTTHWLLTQGDVALDHIASARYAAFDGSINTRLLNDRVAVILTGSHWVGLSSGPSFSNGEAAALWRSNTQGTRGTLAVLAGVGGASRFAPLAAWPGASSGKGRGALLRAHPLLEDGIVVGEAFGRRLVFSTIEYQRPVWSSPYGAVSLAGFVDSARAWHRVDPAATARPVQVDIGTGVRMDTPGGNGTVRLDIGYGLRDGNFKLSAGYVLPWGRR